MRWHPGLLLLLLFPTALAYALSTWAVRRSSPALVAAYNTLQPVVACLLAASFLGERFGWPQGVGFALILAGLAQVSTAPPHPPNPLSQPAPPTLRERGKKKNRGG